MKPWTSNDDRRMGLMFSRPAVRFYFRGNSGVQFHLRRNGQSLFVGSQRKCNELLDGVILRGEPCGKLYDGGEGI